MPNQLQWTILDVEEEEWSTIIGAVGAGNSEPVAGAIHGRAAYYRDRCRPQILISIASLAAVLVIASYAVWQRAEHGLAHMENDIAVAVRAEALHEDLPVQNEHAFVEAVEFLDGQAAALITLTQTLASGELCVTRETRFFAPTPKGWQRTGPITAYWGEPQALDTPSLHFVFRSRDRLTVESLAPSADDLYVALEQVTGQTLSPTAARLTIQIVPDPQLEKGLFAEGQVWLPSPLLFAQPCGEQRSALLAAMLRKTLVSQLLDQALQAVPTRPQWKVVVDGLSLYLQYSADLPLAPDLNAIPYWLQTGADGSLCLAELLTCAALPLAPEPWATYNQQRLTATAEGLVGFLVVTRGRPVLAALLQGIGQYDDWETLAPPVLGDKAASLEAAWHALPQVTEQHTSS